MVWAKLDDEILDNEKIVNAGPLGFALHVAAITWCCRNLTDGFIPRSKVRALLDFEGLHVKTGEGEFVMHEKAVEPLDLADSLVVEGLWIEDEERRGYWLNDFLDYNPSREKVLAERERGKERAKASHEAKQKRRPAPAASSGEDAPKLRGDFASPSDGPVPVPDPVPETPSDEGVSSRAREGGGRVSLNLPLAEDARKIWDARTFTKPAGKPIEDVWANFLGHYAGHNFGTRESLVGRWSKWVDKQCDIHASERQAEYDRKDALARREAKFDKDRERQREAAAAPQPYHRVVKPPKDEPVASPKEQAEAMAKIQSLFGMKGTGT